MEKDIELATPTTERTFVLEELTLDDSSKSEATPTESKSKYSKFWAWASVFSACVSNLVSASLKELIDG